MRIRKLFRFEAAHRLSRHAGRCAGVHGHSYRVEVVLRGAVDDRTGMVKDFHEVGELVGGFIDRFDHSLIFSMRDPLGFGHLREINERHIVTPYEPTAEMMAAHIFWFCKKEGLGEVAAVRVWETESGWAECDDLVPCAFERTLFSDKTLEGK